MESLAWDALDALPLLLNAIFPPSKFLGAGRFTSRARSHMILNGCKALA